MDGWIKTKKKKSINFFFIWSKSNELFCSVYSHGRMLLISFSNTILVEFCGVRVLYRVCAGRRALRRIPCIEEALYDIN